MDGSVDDYAALKLIGEAAADQFGIDVAGGGDVVEKVMMKASTIVTAPYTGGTLDSGSAYVFTAPSLVPFRRQKPLPDGRQHLG